LSGYVGAILAAGQGTRMGALGEDYPKALLPLANEPLIGHHLRFLHGLGIREVYVLVGHRAAELISVLGAGEAYGVNLNFVEQGPYLGSAHALGRLRGLISQPFLLMLGDYYCALSDPGRLLERLGSGASAIAAKREPDRRLLSEACELQVDAAGRLLSIVEKPSEPQGDLKGCGVYALQPDFFDAVARTPRTALRDEYELTHSLQLHVDAGRPVYGEDIVVWDRNFTRPEDVLESNLKWLERAGQNSLIAKEAFIDEGVRFERTVVGDHARVTKGSDLTDVVVFPGAKLTTVGPLSRALVTRDGLYRFGNPGVAVPTATPAGQEIEQ
jgi:NDP-sugar pyrophosphorylase family protein